MPTLSGPVEKVNYSFPVDDHKKINKPFQWVSGNSGGQILEPTYQNNFPISWYSLRQPALLGSCLGGRFDQWRYDYCYFAAFYVKNEEKLLFENIEQNIKDAHVRKIIAKTWGTILHPNLTHHLRQFHGHCYVSRVRAFLPNLGRTIWGESIGGRINLF